MGKANKTPKRRKSSGSKKDPDLKILVDENGEPLISDDPDQVPPPDEELETTPPYVPPPPAEGP